MSTIPSSPLPTTTSSAAFDRPAKTSHHGHAHAARNSATSADGTNNSSESTATGLDSALARIQGQNQASALASLADLQEAMAATRSAQQLMQTQANAARAAHAGVTSAAALRVLEN